MVKLISKRNEGNLGVLSTSQSEIPRILILAFGKVPQSLEHEPVTPEANMIIINTDEQFWGAKTIETAFRSTIFGEIYLFISMPSFNSALTNYMYDMYVISNVMLDWNSVFFSV